ncbi:MAG: hypothetical protein AAB710_02890 [Patescibacteria group bacterium]
MERKIRIVLVLSIICLAAFFRFWHITDTPPGLYPDEAMNGNNAVEALKNTSFSAEGGPAFGWKIFYPENNGREGLFINIQAISVWLFGNEPWALRIVSAFFGTLTVLGMYLLTKELFTETNPQTQSLKLKTQNYNTKFKSFTFLTVVLRFALYALRSVQKTATFPKNELIALLSAFFLATSFWHINFSRIGFRAIMVPFFLVWSFYFLYRLIRSLREEPATSYKPELFAVAGGILFGLGFHTYIAYRLAPLLLIPPFFLAWHEYRNNPEICGSPTSAILDRKCSPCLLVLFLFAAFVAALPMGYYFLQHPEDFAGRTGQVSAFAGESPLQIISLNIIKTIGMFFWAGDYNWRHNFAGNPQLWWPVSILFAIGLVVSIKDIIQSSKFKVQNYSPKLKNFKLATITLHSLATPTGFLLWWLIVMSIPAVISNEGIPHALRVIGMIPPAMIFSALGFVWIVEKTGSWLEKQKQQWLDYTGQLTRIGWELCILAIVFLIAIPIHAAKQYFLDWAHR